MHQFQCRRGLYFLQMSLNGVCIRSVFEQKIGPYKVCIFVNVGQCGSLWKSGSTGHDETDNLVENDVERQHARPDLAHQKR